MKSFLIIILIVALVFLFGCAGSTTMKVERNNQGQVEELRVDKKGIGAAGKSDLADLYQEVVRGDNTTPENVSKMPNRYGRQRIATVAADVNYNINYGVNYTGANATGYYRAKPLYYDPLGYNGLGRIVWSGQVFSVGSFAGYVGISPDQLRKELKSGNFSF